MLYFYLKENIGGGQVTFHLNGIDRDKVHVTLVGSSQTEKLDKILSIEDARTLWRDLVKNGWRRVSRLYTPRITTPMPYRN